MTLANVLFVMRLAKIEYKLLRWLWLLVDRSIEVSRTR